MENNTHNIEQFPLTIKVRVTRLDLKNEYVHPNTCPIASAIKRVRPDLDVFVGSCIVNLWTRRHPLCKGPFPVYMYSLRKKDIDKAYSRSYGKLLCQIIGGFDVVMTRL